MNDPARLWADPRLVYTVAAFAVALLVVTLWLFGRRKRQGRQAAVICLLLSIAMHGALIFLVPMIPNPDGGSSSVDADAPAEPGLDSIEFSSFDPDVTPEEVSSRDIEAPLAPLPVEDLAELLQTPSPAERSDPEPSSPETAVNETTEVPASLAAASDLDGREMMDEIDSQLGDLLEEMTSPQPAVASSDSATSQTSPEPIAPTADHATDQATAEPAAAPSTPAPPNHVPGAVDNDFANRVGQAKQLALLQTGGNAQTEAAVEAALRFLARSQRSDGAWDARASGAGRETRPILGTQRPGTGARAESALTGLALLTMMGAGHTHRDGDYSDQVYRGLAYLIRTQKPDGSLAGEASPYAANYSHGMAALAMCEAAAMTADAAAIESARRAIRYTLAQQHPTTGGWRYLPGDPGDLSQLGWQAMVIDAGHRAKIPIDRNAINGIERFLRSVRRGATGGLACYRPEEAPSRTMTAEALATRLLIGEKVPSDEVAEAERYLLAQPPGVGRDNYYYWYYATLALHQLQDDAWTTWNAALQSRLLGTQRSDGSWSSDTMWGGYGGTVYTTSMAALCLEAYYRHRLRPDDSRMAHRPGP